MLVTWTKSTCLIVTGGILLAGSSALAQSQHETVTARDLLRLKQVELIQSAMEKNKGKAAESLYRAQLTLATWDKLPNTRAARAQATMQYVRDVEAYLKIAGAQVDGQWALDHVKFIVGTLTEPVVSRMEYWGISERDRQELSPIAALLGALRDVARDKINSATEAAEKRLMQDPRAEKEYMTLYSAQQECEYYQAWAGYVIALAMPARDDARPRMLAECITQLGKWVELSEDDSSAQIRYSALLLRGKALAQAMDFAGAQKDFVAASDAKAPAWVRFQAQYPRAIQAPYGEARKSAEAFKRWVDSTPAVASAQTRVVAELLIGRIARLQALENRNARDAMLAEADQIARQMLRKYPQMKEMILESIATQLPQPVGASSGSLTDLENLSAAWAKLIRPILWADDESQQQEYRAALACAQAAAASSNKSQLPIEKTESALLVAIAYGKLGQWLPAAQANIEFVEKYQGDARAPDAAQLALAQLAEFRKAAANTAEVQQLTLRALSAAIDRLGQKQWMYAKGVALEELKQRAQAVAIYNSIARGDEHYLDARYRMLRIAVDELGELQAASAPIDKQKQAAKSLINHCEAYLAEADKLPADALQRQYIPDIWLMEVGVNLNPLEQPEAALKRLADFEKRATQLPAAMMGAVLRYKVQAYQLAGNSEKAAASVREFALKSPQEGPEFIRMMVAQQTQEIARLEKSDPDKASKLAAGVTGLLDPLIATAQVDETKKKDAYTYRQLKADMLARAGKGADSQALWIELQRDRPGDLYNFLGEARAMFVTRQYDLARDLFSRILPKVPVGSESYWECYLRIVQADEARGKPVDAKRLKDLKVVFGDAVGGREFKDEFAAVMKKYAE